MGSNKGLGFGALLGGPVGAIVGAVRDKRQKDKHDKSKKNAAQATSGGLALGKSSAAKEITDTTGYDALGAQRQSVSALRDYGTGTDNTGYVKRTLGA